MPDFTICIDNSVPVCTGQDNTIYTNTRLRFKYIGDIVPTNNKSLMLSWSNGIGYANTIDTASYEGAIGIYPSNLYADLTQNAINTIIRY